MPVYTNIKYYIVGSYHIRFYHEHFPFPSHLALLLLPVTHFN